MRRAGAHGWWVVAGIAVLLAATNPPVEAHRDELRRAVRTALRQEVDKEAKGAGRLAAAALQHFGGDRVIDLLLDVEYQNFLVLSWTRMDDDVVSVGVLGNVFTLVSKRLPAGKRRPVR